MSSPDRYCLLFGLLLVQSPATAADAPTGLLSDVVFGDYTELSSNTELMRRAMTPLELRHALQAAERSGVTLRPQPIDLARERFTLYVPAAAPLDGYALMVFVSPWPRATVPSHWFSVLDRHGMILVSAENSGNDASPLGRREPLTLLAAANVMRRYKVDPGRVYVGGFSGGSRVALRLAVAYPDLFRGALLAAGSDPLGEGIAVPPAGLFERFQEDSRLVYLTGEHDDFHRNADNVSRHAMGEFCVLGTDTEIVPWTGHDLPDPGALDHALTVLTNGAAIDAGRLARCRADLDRDMTELLHQVEALVAAGRRDDARSLLDRTDLRYGGLAAPRSVELVKNIETPP